MSYIGNEDLYRQAMQQYAELAARDRRDAEFFVNSATLAKMQHSDDLLPGYTFLFGIRVRTDDNLPDGVIQLLAETELDRAVRRASERGHTLNVVSPLSEPFLYPPTPNPTLKTLLKHWWKKCTNWRR